jgi:hypothetical protein
MTDYYRISDVVFSLSGLFNPGKLGWSMENLTSWTEVNADWKKYYSTKEGRSEIASLALKDLSFRFKDRDLESEHFGDYKEDFASYISSLKKALEEYKYNTSDKAVFFKGSRLASCMEGIKEQSFKNILQDLTWVKSERLTKEELLWVIETYDEVFNYVADNINKRPVDVERLTRLELPVQVDELRELVLTCENLGELFPWKKTQEGFRFWANVYLDTNFFQQEVYQLLNRLHPELKLKVQKAEPKPKSLFKKEIFTGGAVAGNTIVWR